MDSHFVLVLLMLRLVLLQETLTNLSVNIHKLTQTELSVSDLFTDQLFLAVQLPG